MCSHCSHGLCPLAHRRCRVHISFVQSLVHHSFLQPSSSQTAWCRTVVSRGRIQPTPECLRRHRKVSSKQLQPAATDYHRRRLCRPPRTICVRSRNRVPHVHRARGTTRRRMICGQGIASRRGRRSHGCSRFCSVIAFVRRMTCRGLLVTNVHTMSRGAAAPTEIATRPSSTGGGCCIRSSTATKRASRGWSPCRSCRPPDTGRPLASSTRSSSS